MKNVTAILSMLHEAIEPSSATRLFRGEPVLRWTLKRLSRTKRIGSVALLCWEDQLETAARLAAEADAFVLAKGPRVALPEVEAVAAARRWSDGWRGGLLSTCDFDLGFYGPWFLELANRVEADAALLVDPASALVDPLLLDGIVSHAESHPDSPICFVPAAPGLGGALVKRDMLERLAASKTHVGRLLHYLPDQLSREPLAGEGCAPTPVPVARTTHRFKLDSSRQIVRLSAATISLNGQLISSSAEEIVHRVHAWDATDALPREVVLELNTRRGTRPIFWPAAHCEIDRPDLPLEQARVIIDELSAIDDTRLTLAGVGDPLLYDGLFELIELAKATGAIFIHVETDFQNISPATIARLAASHVDVVSVHLPALTARMYEQVMGVSGYENVLEHVRAFIAARAGRGMPILVPTFTKCRQNLGEMESWYDQWLRAMDCAVIRGPSDYAGLIPDVAAADMSPPRRKPCARLSSRLTILSDGRIVSCEEDVLGRQVMGRVGTDSLKDVWQERFSAMRAAHRESNWEEHPVCAKCREWHRT